MKINISDFNSTSSVISWMKFVFTKRTPETRVSLSSLGQCQLLEMLSSFGFKHVNIILKIFVTLFTKLPCSCLFLMFELTHFLATILFEFTRSSSLMQELTSYITKGECFLVVEIMTLFYILGLVHCNMLF